MTPRFLETSPKASHEFASFFFAIVTWLRRPVGLLPAHSVLWIGGRQAPMYQVWQTTEVHTTFDDDEEICTEIQAKATNEVAMAPIRGIFLVVLGGCTTHGLW